jgi:polyhydroxybutyrate depolymerase
MKTPGFLLLVILAFAVTLSAVSCRGTSPTPTPTFTPTPTNTPTPTITLTPTPTSTPTIQPGVSTHSILVSGAKRLYTRYVPSNLSKLNSVPVVFAFHPWFGTSTDMMVLTLFNSIAEQNNFLVIYPQGIDDSWNAGGCCGTAMDQSIDDIAFVRQMLSDLETMVPIDPKRIYATGWSNGGILAYRLACEMSDTFAAIAPVAGVLWYSPCQPEQPVSVMHVHGMNDKTVPFEGGKSDLEDLGIVPHGLIVPSVSQGIATWVQLDGCAGSPVEEKQDVITHISYTSCRAGTTVELYKIDYQDHLYPQLFPTSKKIWEFFAANPKP